MSEMVELTEQQRAIVEGVNVVSKSQKPSAKMYYRTSKMAS